MESSHGCTTNLSIAKRFPLQTAHQLSHSYKTRGAMMKSVQSPISKQMHMQYVIKQLTELRQEEVTVVKEVIPPPPPDPSPPLLRYNIGFEKSQDESPQRLREISPSIQSEIMSVSIECINPLAVMNAKRQARYLHVQIDNQEKQILTSRKLLKKM